MKKAGRSAQACVAGIRPVPISILQNQFFFSSPQPFILLIFYSPILFPGYTSIIAVSVHLSNHLILLYMLALMFSYESIASQLKCVFFSKKFQESLHYGLWILKDKLVFLEVPSDTWKQNAWLRRKYQVIAKLLQQFTGGESSFQSLARHIPY